MTVSFLSTSVLLASGQMAGQKIDKPKPPTTRVKTLFATILSRSWEEGIAGLSTTLAPVSDAVEHLVVTISGELGLVGVVVCVAHCNTNPEGWQIAPLNKASIALIMPLVSIVFS